MFLEEFFEREFFRIGLSSVCLMHRKNQYLGLRTSDDLDAVRRHSRYFIRRWRLGHDGSQAEFAVCRIAPASHLQRRAGDVGYEYGADVVREFAAATDKPQRFRWHFLRRPRMRR